MTEASPTETTILNIPPQMSFVDCLAKELLRRHGEDLQSLGDVTILTTTRRAARALQNAFLRETGGRPLLLPRMRPIGDVDEDELALEGDLGLDAGFAGSLDLPPAMESLRRQLLLARLIEKRDPERHDFTQAVGLSLELARLLDQVQTEGVDFAELKNLVPDEYAAHWQVILQFLTIISDVWPTILEAEGAIDPAHRRDLLLRRQVAEWQKNPPKGHIYAVGSTGSIPATAELLQLVANLPKGCVILPGLDRHLDDTAWDLLEEEPSHPQYGLARLIASAGLRRDQIPDICIEAAQSCSIERVQFLSEAMRPAQTTDQWQKAFIPSSEDLGNIQQVNCSGAQGEAQVVALLMRETLTHPTKTAVLVTLDRDLSRRVSTELKRWDIDVDDSAGTSLDQSPAGVFLRLTARMMAEKCDPVAMLAALKHPYAALGMPRTEFRSFVRAFEVAVLRGPRPAPGLKGLRDVLDYRIAHKKVQEGLDDWFEKFRTLAEPFAALSNQKEVDFIEYLKAHVEFCEGLSVGEDETAPQIWKGQFGEAAASFISELLRAGEVAGPINPGSWPDLMDSLMIGRMVRSQYGHHPRLQIWGPIEGRLQRADLMILGGLNKGVWPPEAGNDPWMSRPMRQEFKLPLPEKKVGLSAHDFQQAFCAKEVVLTRAEKVDGTPTVPSRWLLRLETLLKKSNRNLEGDGSHNLLHWQGLLDQPKSIRPICPPRPTPPVKDRPRRLSVTRIEKWIKDPYSIFADAILGLRPLRDIGEDPGAAEKGTFIHKALENFVGEYPKDLPLDALEKLLEFGREAFGDVLSYPAVWAFWWPRFERIASWFVEFEIERRTEFKSVLLEKKGVLRIPAPMGVFELSGTADRIDQNALGELSIVDYKTGAPPSVKQVESGVSPQLALEAAMVERAAFESLKAGSVIELLYIRLSGSDPAGETRSASKKMEPEELAKEAFEGLQRLIAQFDNEATPYLTKPRPEFQDPFNDYEHLARVKEWSGGGSNE